MKQTTISLFASMSFVTPLVYSVPSVIVVDHQLAVTIYSGLKTVSMKRLVHADVTPGLDSS